MKKGIWNEHRDYYKSEINMFREVLSKEEFLEWYEDVPQYDFELGQEPDLKKIKENDINSTDLKY